jgi:hypothetical protein
MYVFASDKSQYAGYPEIFTGNRLSCGLAWDADLGENDYGLMCGRS